jgi:hypothetical protein
MMAVCSKISTVPKEVISKDAILKGYVERKNSVIDPLLVCIRASDASKLSLMFCAHHRLPTRIPIESRNITP